MAIHDYSTGEMPAGDDPKWTTAELRLEFEVSGFSAPFVTVTRKSDGVRGTLQFNHDPRIYFDFIPNA